MDTFDVNRRRKEAPQMIPQGSDRRFVIIIIAFLCIWSGCTTALRNSETEKVAKDWSLVIRASQVIPVYPLTEDLQPGDVLLVSMPIEEQVKIYKAKGYLPLDQLVKRLYTRDHSTRDFYNFYNARYGIDENAMPPVQWQTPTGGKNHNWGIAPLAAFPAYQFEVSTGTGLNVAIPIQGIPFALGLMNSGRASGTVTIADSHTFGLDNCQLERAVNDWASKDRHLLRNYSPRDDEGIKKYHFLRVVSRVYVVGSVNVILRNAEATGAEAAAGADRPLNLMGLQEGKTPENYSAAINAINNLLKDQMPGVKAKIATASSRSVTLNQSFDRPVVIGYVGFDMPILRGGRLGAPISTLAQLTHTKALPPTEMGNAYVYRLASLSHVAQALEELEKHGDPGAKDALAKLNRLSALLPDVYPFTVYHQPSPGAIEVFQKAGLPVDKKRGFSAVIDYQGDAFASRESIEIYLRNVPSGSGEQIKYWEELRKVQTAMNDLRDKLSDNPDLMEAIEYAFLENSR